MNAIRQTDLVLGGDIGVIDESDLDISRRVGTPPSTWRVDGRRIGAEAARELIDRIEDPSAPAAVVKIPVEFVDRGTA